MVYPKLTVSPPTSAPYRYGLQSVVIPRTDDVDRALLGGVEYNPDTCGWTSSTFWRDPECDPALLTRVYLNISWAQNAGDPTKADLTGFINGGGGRWAWVTVDGGPQVRVRFGAGYPIATAVDRNVPITVSFLDPYSNQVGSADIVVPAAGALGAITYPDALPEIQASAVKNPVNDSAHAGLWSPVGATPFTVYSSFDCAGVSVAEARERLTAQFALREPVAVEEAFWYGRSDAFGMSPTLQSSPYSGTWPETATGIREAVARLEDAYYWWATNMGVIHAPRWVYPFAAAAGLIVRDRNVLRTPLDTLWAFGVGYNAYEGPDDATASAGDGQAWMYMTGPVSQWRSEVLINPPAEQALDRFTNHVELVAERTYLLAFDCHAVSVLADFNAAAGGSDGGF